MTSVCGSGSQRGIQFGQAFGYSIANMFGFGSIIEKSAPTPLDQLQKQITQKQNDTQQLINNAALTAATLDASIASDVVGSLKGMQSVLEEESLYHDEILREKISSNSAYIMYLFIIVMTIYVFLLLIKFN